MARRTSRRDYPPLIRDKWQAAKSKSEKQDIFGLYLCCGGDIGRMEAIESVTQSESWRSADSHMWFTKDDLDVKFHGRAEVISDLIQRCSKDPSLHRPHPDFPHLQVMTQYKALESSKESHEQAYQKLRCLHWSGHVEGQVALELAANLEKMFGPEGFVVSPVAAAKAAGAEAKAKSRAKSGGGAPKAKGASTPKHVEDPRKIYADKLRMKCNEFIATMRELRSKLGTHAWTEALRSMMDTEIRFFESSHDTFATLAQAPSYTDATMDAALDEYRTHVSTTVDYIHAADNMLGIKKRRIAGEPARPVAKSEPAAESAAH
jgi:hypothetical protein